MSFERPSLVRRASAALTASFSVPEQGSEKLAMTARALPGASARSWTRSGLASVTAAVPEATTTRHRARRPAPRVVSQLPRLPNHPCRALPSRGPSHTSSPGRPRRRRLPSLPPRVVPRKLLLCADLESRPGPPKIVSSSAPPWIVSSPGPPSIWSLPVRAQGVVARAAAQEIVAIGAVDVVVARRLARRGRRPASPSVTWLS